MSGDPSRTAALRTAARTAWATAALALGAAGQDLSQHHVFTFRGDGVGLGLGAAAVAVGDLDGDGHDELAVGAPDGIGASGGRVVVFDGATGATRLELLGPAPTVGASGRFGTALAVVDDLDGDGLPELAVGAPRDDGGGHDAGAVELRSTVDGALLERFEGLPGERLGATLAALDADGDGVLDLAIGGPGSGADGVVVVRSGAWLRAAVLGELPPGPQFLFTGGGTGRFGAALAALPDLDGDGLPELAVGAPLDAGVAGTRAGSVTVLSGAGGAPLARLEGDRPDALLGAALAVTGSLDGDAVAELAVGAPGGGADRRGSVRVWSGAWLAAGGGSGGLVLELSGAAADDRFGGRLAAVPDATGDGLDELAVVAARLAAPDGRARLTVHSGADGAPLFTADADGPDERFGAALGVAQVVDDPDGAPGAVELLVGAPAEGLDERGRLRVVAFAPRPLAIAPHRLSIDAGGTAELSLASGPSLGSQLYVLIGSASGVAPGLETAAGALPIHFDGYSLYSLSNPPDLIAFNGALDPDGRAAALVVVPPGANPGLAKFQLHYAFLTVDLSAPGFPTTSVSNAVPLGFELDQCTATAPDLDCNGNGVLDPCDIADGTSLDCDGDGVPDECQLGLPAADVDHDGVLDACRAVVRVDVDAIGAGDGTSWADAYPSLRTALAQAPDLAELWVAEGTYRPTDDPTDGAPSFVLRDGLALFGGFAGGETARDQRDPDAYPTVLSGDVLGDDGLPGGSVADNVWNVVAVPEGVGPTTVLDGFRVEGGNADDLAGCDLFAIYFSSCRGGGLYCQGSPVVRDCRFRSNFGGHHGGAVFTDGSPTFVDCLFEANGALRGGAVYADIGARPRLVRCVLVGNDALEGGAAYALGSGDDGLELTNCLVVGNHALAGAGAVQLVGARADLVHTTLAANTSEGPTGGVVGELAAAVELTNAILWGNGGTAGDALARQLDVLAPTVRYSCVEGGTPGAGGPGNLAADPQFIDLAGPDGQVGTADDDGRLAAGSPCRDAGDSTAVPPDWGDVDGDGDRTEALPLDLLDAPRVADDPLAPDLGQPAPGGAVVDMGPTEA